MSMAPGASSADPGVRQAATSQENFPVIRFDDTSTEHWDFLCALEGYEGGGLTIEIPWAATTATSGTTDWEIGLRRIADDAEDLDLNHPYAYNVSSPTAPSAAGEISYDTITFTDGADMDSVADGERFMMRLRRTAGGMSGDAELLWPAIIIRET